MLFRYMEYWIKGKVGFLESRLRYTMLIKKYKKKYYFIIWDHETDKTDIAWDSQKQNKTKQKEH